MRKGERPWQGKVENRGSHAELSWSVALQGWRSTVSLLCCSGATSLPLLCLPRWGETGWQGYWCNSLESVLWGSIYSVAKGLLRGIDHVEEAVFVLLLLVDLRDGGGNAHHAMLVHQQEEGLGGVQLQAASGKREKGRYFSIKSCVYIPITPVP